MMLEKALKQAIKELRKVKDVLVYLGRKKVDSTFHRLNDEEFLVKISHIHKETKHFTFDTIKMVNKANNETISRRKLGHIYELMKLDEYNLTWNISAKISETESYNVIH